MTKKQINIFMDLPLQTNKWFVNVANHIPIFERNVFEVGVPD